MDCTLVILAAGMGSRYGGLKQVDPVGPSGETIMDYSLFDAIRAGFSNVVFVIREEMKQDFHEKIGKALAERIHVEYAFQKLDDIPAGFEVPAERAKPWGTAHAILAARDIIETPFCVINADDFYGASAYQTMAEFLKSKTDVTKPEFSMVGYILANTMSPHGSVARGICHSVDGFLNSVEEQTKIEMMDGGIVYTDEDGSQHPLTGKEIVSMNFWGFTPAYFEQAWAQFSDFLEAHSSEPKSEFLIPSTVNQLLKDNAASVKVLSSSDPWCGMTYREDRPEVVCKIKESVDAGKYPTPLWDKKKILGS